MLNQPQTPELLAEGSDHRKWVGYKTSTANEFEEKEPEHLTFESKINGQVEAWSKGP